MKEYILSVENAEYNIIINGNICSITIINYETLQTEKRVFEITECIDDVIEILKHDKKYLNDFLQYLKQFSPKRFTIKSKTFRKEYR